MNEIANLYNSFAKHPEGRWIMEPQNARLLYKFIKEHLIKKVLDLGTGIGTSTAVMAQALTDKGEKDWHIDTVEQFDKCVNLAKKLIPEELQKNITFYKAEAVTCVFDGMSYQTFSVYDKIPEGDYDLILNDGPAPWEENNQWIDLPNATVTTMLLENKIRPGCFIVWDGRIHMLKLLERFYGDNFYLVRPQQREDDLNILERKDNPVAYKDSMLEAIKLTSYFK